MEAGFGHIRSLDLPKITRFIMLSRALDELEVRQLTPKGKVKYQFSAGGHELEQVLVAQTLEHPHDAAAVYYRSRPFMLACGLTPSEALAGGMALSGSPSQGRDVGVMFNLPARNGPTIFPTSGNVGAQYTPATGWAQAIRYRQQTLGKSPWQGAIAVAMGGDGSVATNGFWASLNIATTLQLPLLYVIEDNGYGISVPATLQTPGGNIATNLRGYGGLKVLEGDGGDVLTAWPLINEAVVYVRSGLGPCLLRMAVPRLSGHTFIDDQSYKPAETLAEDAECDPLERLAQAWLVSGLTGDAWTALHAEVEKEVAQALQVAEASPDPDPDKMTDHLFYTGVAPLQGGLRPENAHLSPTDAAPHQRSTDQFRGRSPPHAGNGDAPQSTPGCFRRGCRPQRRRAWSHPRYAVPFWSRASFRYIALGRWHHRSRGRDGFSRFTAGTRDPVP